MADLKTLADQLVNLTVKEVNELSTLLKENYGIEATAMATPVVVAGGENDQTDAPAEQTEFKVVLNAYGPNKIKVIKAIREILGLNLKDAKQLVDNCPSNLKENAAKEEAESLKKQLEDLSAEVELK